MNTPLPYAQPVKKETLAEQVAAQIKEAILDDIWEPGDALPTEPQLAEAYGVSRAVVRDATRMLAARGLVEAQHGRGVFVTESQAAAFGEALLLALRRDGATVWDVEQFEQMVFPEVCALAAAQATAAERERLTDLGQAYIAYYAETLSQTWDDSDENNPAWDQARVLFNDFLTAVFQATHNALWRLLAQPLFSLRNFRNWEPPSSLATPQDLIRLERRFIDTVTNAIVGADPAAARRQVQAVMRLPAEAESAMRSTRIGDIPHIRAPQQPD